MKLSDVIDLVQTFMIFKLFEINKTAITPSSIFMFVVFIAVFAVTSRLLQRVLKGQVFSRLSIDEGMQYTLTRITHYLIMIVGAVVAFQFIGIDLPGLAIIVGDQEGDVMEINMRSTTIRTLKNIAVIVPNSEFVSSKLENWSYGDETVRVDVNVGVSYESDLETVIRSLREVAAEHPQVLKNPAPDVLHTGFGDSAWNMRLRIWLEDSQRHLEVHSEINCAIVRKFQQNRVEIPFPQRDLH